MTTFATQPKMEWSRIHEDKCPICAFAITQRIEGDKVLFCANPKCDFKITKERLAELKQTIKKPKEDEAPQQPLPF